MRLLHTAQELSHLSTRQSLAGDLVMLHQMYTDNKVFDVVQQIRNREVGPEKAKYAKFIGRQFWMPSRTVSGVFINVTLLRVDHFTSYDVIVCVEDTNGNQCECGFSSLTEVTCAC